MLGEVYLAKEETAAKFLRMKGSREEVPVRELWIGMWGGKRWRGSSGRAEC